MIKIYTGGRLAYDSRNDFYSLQGLKIRNAVNKGGTATITMPPGHAAFNLFRPYKDVVEIYRKGELRFRGRALPPTIDFYGNKTITCEGELCFLRDGISRPYSYTDTPEGIFRRVIANYNTTADDDKTFQIGEVTVLGFSEHIRLESDEAETTLDTINRLLDLEGGYISISSSAGQRVINWYAELDRRCWQTIELGENLLSLRREDDANEEFATAVLPYGARNETTGVRLGIAGVTDDGADYIQDDAAVAERGFILATVTWDEVISATSLLARARAWLSRKRQILTTLEVSAIDLSFIEGRALFTAGSWVKVKSKPHGIDDDFLIAEYEEDLLDPPKSKITLGTGKLRSLTAGEAARNGRG